MELVTGGGASRRFGSLLDGGAARNWLACFAASVRWSPWWQGIRIVKLPTAIARAIASGVPTYLIRQALDRAGRTSVLPAAERARLTADLEARDGLA